MTGHGAPRVLSLSEVAVRLGMKRPNVAKFLARRGIAPAFGKAQGYFWFEEDIERVKAEREADPERMAADERRRRAAMRNADRVDVKLPVRLGHTQRDILASMLRRPVLSGDDGARLALRRLEGRGYVERVPGGSGEYQLTKDGRELAAML